MKLLVNGEIKNLEIESNAATLEKVISQLGHNPRLVVVEFNGAILSPAHWSQQQVEEEDKIEIVTIVGGGS